MPTVQKSNRPKKRATSKSTPLVRRSGLSTIQQLSVFAFVLVVGFTGYMLTFGTHAATSSVTTAKAPTNNYVCDSWGNGYCLNGNSSGGGLATVINKSSVQSAKNKNYAEFYYANVGTVTSTSPFTSGSGDNTLFQGDKIVQIKYTPISGVQLCPDLAVEGEVTICTNVSYWAVDGTHLVSVGLTNKVFGQTKKTKKPYYLNTVDSNGAHPNLSPNKTNLATQNWLQS